MKMLKQKLDEISEKLSKVFDYTHIEELALGTKFVQRRGSKINGVNFLQMVLSSAQELSTQVKLSDNVAFLRDQDNIQIRKQSVCERYNAHSVDFVKAVLEELLQAQRALLPIAEMNAGLEGIQILDSTSVELPKELKAWYKGYHGSGAKLELEYELLSGQIMGIDLVGQTTQDLNFVDKNIEQIVPRRLYLRDLGYFSLPTFERLMDQGAYFISRIKSDTKLYNKTYKKGQVVYQAINVAKLIEQMKSRGLHNKSFWAYVGKQKLLLRIVIMSLPPDEVERRRKHVIKRAKSHKQQVKAITLAMCQVNIFMTNLSTEALPLDWIRAFYALRWQIELIFKIWKSVLKLSHFGKMSRFRFETLMYAKLVLIVLSSKVIFALRKILWWLYEFELSEIKAFKAFRQYTLDLTKSQNWFDFKKHIRWRLQQLLESCLEQAKKEVKKHKLSPRQILQRADPFDMLLIKNH